MLVASSYPLYPILDQVWLFSGKSQLLDWVGVKQSFHFHSIAVLARFHYSFTGATSSSPGYALALEGTNDIFRLQLQFTIH